jgi:hypothetical protein
MWIPERVWEGRTVCVAAGGASVGRLSLPLLHGVPTIAVNSSAFLFPRAELVFSMDARWLHAYRARMEPRGGVATDNDHRRLRDWPGLLRLRRGKAEGLSDDPGEVAGYWTSLHGAINLAVHMGAARLVVIGADGHGGYHHGPYPWRGVPTKFGLMGRELATTVDPLARLGVSIVNCSPGTRWDFWPKADRLEDCIP